MEMVGTGIKRIKDFCKNNGNRVKFDFDTSSFFIIISKKQKAKIMGKSSEESSEKSSEKIIKTIKNNPDISAGEIANIIGISQRAIEKNIAKLKRRNLLKRIGPDKGGHWKVIEK